MNLWQKIAENWQQLSDESGIPMNELEVLQGMGGTALTVKPPFQKYQLVMRHLTKDKEAKELAENADVMKNLLPGMNGLPGKGLESFDVFEGLNRGHALWKAKRNWSDSPWLGLGKKLYKKEVEIEPVGRIFSPPNKGAINPKQLPNNAKDSDYYYDYLGRLKKNGD